MKSSSPILNLSILSLLKTHLTSVRKKKYTVFLTTEKEQKAYGVIGLYDEIQDVVPPFVPQIVNTILLPFRGKIIYCGFINSYKIYIGANMRRSIQEEYQKAKSRFGIITSLDEPVVEKKFS